MKMIIRADDVGYSAVYDIGAFETIEKGVSTSFDVMLESPDTVGALERLRDYPWISVGWHAHFWNRPVLEAREVPSLVIPETGRFRHDLRTGEEWDPEELRRECVAELERCIDILGRVPDTFENGQRGQSQFDRVMYGIAEEYGIATGYSNRVDAPGKEPVYADEKWADRKIYIMDPGPAYEGVRTESVTKLLEYDPVKYYTENRFCAEQFPEDAILEQSWHPGYVDYYVYREGDYGPNAKYFTVCRVADAHALCSEELKEWIRENRVELINYRDALYGTKEYQNHLRHIGSDLYMG